MQPNLQPIQGTAQPSLYPAAANPPTPADGQDDEYSVDFLRPAGSVECQLDSILLEAAARFEIDERLCSNTLGISGLSDLHSVTTNLHVGMKGLLTDANAAGDTVKKEFSNF